MSSEVERFLARFTRFGAEPSVTTYLALFHADATLFDSGMPRPLTVPEIPEHIEGILKDLTAQLLASAGDDALLFREWELCGTHDGAPVRFGVADRFDLAEGRVTGARTSFDPLVLPA